MTVFICTANAYKNIFTTFLQYAYDKIDLKSTPLYLVQMISIMHN